MKYAQIATVDVDQACVPAGHQMGCKLRPRNHSQAAVATGGLKPQSTFLGEKRPLAVVAAGMGFAAVWV